MIRHAWWLFLACGLCGCAVTSSGFDRAVLQAHLTEENIQVTDDDIRQIQTLRPQLGFPCRIAVALKGECTSWRWTAKDKQMMEAWATTLRQEGFASEVIFMSSMFMHGESLKDMRAAAAKHGADALLVIQGGAVTDSYLNPAALFNMTIVGGFVVPGSHRDALFLIQAGLVDVSNGFLYASMETEGEGSTLAPTFIIEEKDAIDRAKQEALTRFGSEVLVRMRNLRATYAAIPGAVALKR
jgi:rhombotail lipoprotein